MTPRIETNGWKGLGELLAKVRGRQHANGFPWGPILRLAG
jgi:hypothetical protein